MNLRIIKSVLFGLAALALVGQARASSVNVGSSDWTGSCNTSNGLDGGGTWGENGCKISWDITYNSSTHDYTYDWTISNLHGGNLNPGDINHFIVGCGSTFGSKDICPGTQGSVSCGTWNGNNNPGLPCSIFGLDFNNGGAKCTYKLVTDCAPVWGDCYGTDGGKNDVCNQGFCSDGGEGCNGNPDTNCWIPCPGCPATVVPLPSSLWMGMLTLGAMAIAGLVRRQRVRV